MTKRRIKTEESFYEELLEYFPTFQKNESRKIWEALINLPPKITTIGKLHATDELLLAATFTTEKQLKELHQLLARVSDANIMHHGINGILDVAGSFELPMLLASPTENSFDHAYDRIARAEKATRKEEAAIPTEIRRSITSAAQIVFADNEVPYSHSRVSGRELQLKSSTSKPNTVRL